LSTTYQQATIAVADPASFQIVASAIDQRFSPQGVETYFRALEKSSIRVRDFAAALAAGKLGPDSAAAYARLNDGDQGMIRELYLASLEKVPMDLRDKFFKLYAYY
jgi:hypothetical protein